MADKELVKDNIVKYIERNGKKKFIDIFKWLSIKYAISQGTVSNYLDELVNENKLRTWYDKSRFYDLPVDNEEVKEKLVSCIENAWLFKKPMTSDDAQSFLIDNGTDADDALKIIMSLHDHNKIRLIRKGGKTILAPPPFPLSLKVFFILATSASLISLFIGIYLDFDISLFFPFTIFILFVTCFVWYCQEKNLLR